MNTSELIQIARIQTCTTGCLLPTTSKALLEELEKACAKLALIESKFKSRNSVDVERILLTRKEWYEKV